MFTRVGAAAIKKDLTNTIALCDALNNPQTRFKTLHVAGTNGKGSVSHILASVLQSAGYKTGLYTSPHLKDFRERVKINGEMISQQFVVDFVAENKNLFSTISPSFFEMTVALCFDYFAKEGVEIAVIETGLGGRLDSTNIINPQLSVITNIGWDHMDMLGDTLELIAGEKAGIIKPNTPTVIGETQQETTQIFIDKAQNSLAPIVFADGEYSIQNFDNRGATLVCDVYKGNVPLLLQLQCDLTGIYQQKNIITAIAAIEQLQQAGYKISESNIRDGFAQVKNQTGLLGRWQKLSDSPLTYADTGHNLNGVQEVLKQLQLLQYTHLHIVWGMVKDKDISKILALLPTTATYYFCNAQIPRALAAEDLQQQAITFGLKGEAYSTIELAVKAAQNAAQATDLVFVGGSTFVVAEAV